VPEPRHHTGPAPARLRDRPSWLISRAYARASGLLNEAFEANAAGLRSYHYRLLAAVHEWGPASQADLGRGTSIDRSDVTAALTELETRGLVERTVDPDHKRRNIVSITDAGTEQLALLDQVVTGVQDQLLAPLTPAQRTQFVTLMHKMLD
jgi:DNA-binding MarR family transcriptional regulator